MALTLYGLKNCDTCRKALKQLETTGQAVDFVDIRSEADLTQKVPVWLQRCAVENLLNKRSTSWRNLNDAARTGEPADLLIAHPTLIKRPVIESGEDLYVGWTKEVQAKLI